MPILPPSAIQAMIADIERKHGDELRRGGAEFDCATKIYFAADQMLRHWLGDDWVDKNTNFKNPHRFLANREGEVGSWRFETLYVDLAELLLNLQEVKGFEHQLAKLKTDLVTAIPELQAARYLFLSAIPFEFIDPQPGLTYDAEMLLEGAKMPCEMKRKVDGTTPSRKTVLNRLRHARRKQLPKGVVSVVMLGVPQSWIDHPEGKIEISEGVEEALRRTTRIGAVIVHWEQQKVNEAGLQRDGLGHAMYNDRVPKSPALVALFRSIPRTPESRRTWLRLHDLLCASDELGPGQRRLPSNDGARMPAKVLTLFMRGPSAAMFERGHPMPLLDAQVGGFNLKVLHWTRWRERKDGIVVPGDLMIKVRAEVPVESEIRTLYPVLANAGNTFLPAISLATNAAVFAPTTEVMASTPHLKQSEYFQAYVESESDEPYSCRIVPIAQAYSLIKYIGAHPESSRLLRACMQYRYSLLNLESSMANVSLAHLWMAVEALTPVQLKALLKSRNLPDADALADALHIPLDPDRPHDRMKALDDYIRETFLLKGDHECYKQCSAATDGFVHGSMDVGAIGAVSFTMRPRLAGLVRSAILRLAQLWPRDIRMLEGPPYSTELAANPCRRYRYIHCTASGEGDVLETALEPDKYPPLSWSSQLVNASVLDGGMNYEFKDQFTARVSNDVHFDSTCFSVKG
jgi:hypothetical protein